MMLSLCLSLGLRRGWSRPIDFESKSLSHVSGCWVGFRRVPYDLGLPRISRGSRCRASGGTPGSVVRWMAPVVRPSKSIPSRRQAGAIGIKPPSVMRKYKMSGHGGASSTAAAAGMSCRRSTLLLGFLISFVLALFVLFGFTFRNSQLSSSYQELDASRTVDGFKDDEGVALEDRRQADEEQTKSEDGSGVSLYGYEIVREFNHDPQAFTQGLLYAGNGTLYESTGLYRKSTVREVDLLTGKVRRTQRMNKQEFGEGLTLWKDRLYQVTWRTQKVFIYDQKTLAPIREAAHHMKDGWGLTTSDEFIIGSDGTSKLYFMRPETFEEVKVLTVKDDDKEVGWLNELEFVEGEILANIWQGECIARISPENGKVTGWILLQGLRSSLIDRGAQHLDVLNGIAWDQENDKLYVTGKLWPKVFEIKLLNKTQNGSLESVRTLCNIGHEGFM